MPNVDELKDKNSDKQWFRDRKFKTLERLKSDAEDKSKLSVWALVFGAGLTLATFMFSGIFFITVAGVIALCLKVSSKHDEYMIGVIERAEELNREKHEEAISTEKQATENRYLDRGERFNKYLANPKTDIKLPEVDPKNEDTYRYYIVRNGFLPYFDSDYSIDGIDKLSYLEHNVYLYYDGVSLKELVTGVPAKMWSGDINNQTLYFDSLTEIKDLSQIGNDIKSYGVENYKKYIFDTISYNTVLARYSVEASKGKNNAENFVKGLIDNYR